MPGNGEWTAKCRRHVSQKCRNPAPILFRSHTIPNRRPTTVGARSSSASCTFHVEYMDRDEWRDWTLFKVDGHWGYCDVFARDGWFTSTPFSLH